jgi:hypothetical protein
MTVFLRGRAALLLIMLALVFSGLLPSTSEALQGGPDAFGYSYRDSNAVGGPQYVWEDIVKTGTDYKKEFEAGDNYLSTKTGHYDKTIANSMDPAIPIGFNFDFYGRTYSYIRLAGNGYITFSLNSNRNYVYDGSSMPSKSEPNNIIAPFWGWNDTFS